MRDYVEFSGKVFVCASAYAPNYILQCLLKSMVHIMSVRGEIAEDMPLFIGSMLSQKTAFSNMREIILFGNF